MKRQSRGSAVGFRVAFFTAVTICLAFWQTSIAMAGQRLALIVGNSGYRHTTPLANPKNDATLMSTALTRAGFSVRMVIDADYRGMRAALIEFGRALQGSDIEAGLFYYAGHGIQIHDENFLVPVDAEISGEDEVAFSSINLNEFLRVMNSSNSATNIVVLDACRNNPFARSFRAVSRGLARVDAPKGTLIAYATAPGDVARDGETGNSPYTQSLAQAIETSGGATIESVFKTTRRNVLQITDNKQVPWESSSVVEDFFFHGGNASRLSQQPAEKPAEKPVETAVIPRMPTPSVPQLAPQQQPSAPAPKIEPPVAVRPVSLPIPELGNRARCSASTLAGTVAEMCVSSRLLAEASNVYELGNLSDGRLTTAWVEGVPGDGIGEKILMNFGKPTTVRKIRLINGYAKSTDIFQKNNRVRTLEVTTSAGETRTLELSDNTSWQEFTLSGTSGISWMMLRITSVYRGSKYQDTAISELRVE